MVFLISVSRYILEGFNVYLRIIKFYYIFFYYNNMENLTGLQYRY